MKNSYSDRLHNVIPGGAHTYSRGDDQFPSNAPSILSRGEGAYVWDANGEKFLDYGMALRSVTLGYSHPDINIAVFDEIKKGNNLTRASLTELEAAELFVNTIPSVDMVKFAKNGSNVTTAAIKLARSFTGKQFVCIPKEQPFFSFDDWFIGTTPLTKGIPNDYYSKTLVFNYGDIGSLEKLFDQYEGQIAAVMLEPATLILPCPISCNNSLTEKTNCMNCANKEENFLKKVRNICDKKGALLIFDEMITGFRWSLGGAQDYYDVKPDLTTFGKAMANGFALSALGGKREIMNMGSIRNDGAERTFLLSTTHGAEMSSLRAFIETVNVYKKENVCNHLWKYGADLYNGFQNLVKSHGLEEYLLMDGSPILMNYVTKDINKNSSLAFRTLLNQELIKEKVIMSWISFSLAHKEVELDITLNALNKAFKVYKNALNDGVEKYLEGPIIKPVFRKFN
jgi:glutamate-1-semialdehyde 2,1-aminomutase